VSLAENGGVASGGHERLDGSGYHRGAMAAGVPKLARLLGAADAYHAMSEDRPHRRALAPKARISELRSEARSGRLDPDAVEAVLSAAGHPTRRRTHGPAGLTPREIDVLKLAARGATNRAIGTALGISAKTAGSHIEHIYTKIGVSTRAGRSALRHPTRPRHHDRSEHTRQHGVAPHGRRWRACNHVIATSIRTTRLHHQRRIFRVSRPRRAPNVRGSRQWALRIG
jgi:DNA-binding CsgD family transcriptional regulator